MDDYYKTRIEASRKAYERLLKDENYTEVRFNPENGALSAVHIDHNFDPTIGKFGIPRGDYERKALSVLFEYGNRVILESEKKGYEIKTPDGFLNGTIFDIKGIEGSSRRAIKDAFSKASGQGAEIVVLYFHDKNMLNIDAIKDSYSMYLINSRSKRIKTIYCITGKYVYKI